MILEGSDPVSAAEISGRPQVARYPFHLDQIAVVVWTDSRDTKNAEELASLCSRIADAVGAVSVLTAAEDETTMWAWLALPEAHIVDLDALNLERLTSTGFFVAVSEPHHALPGFRTAMADALRVRSLVCKSEPSHRRRVTLAADVGAVAMMAGDLQTLRQWVSTILGELAGNDPEYDDLRETLYAYLRNGGSLTRAGQELHLHKNTVLKRVRAAKDLCRRDPGNDTSQIETALRACHFIGAPVLTEPW